MRRILYIIYSLFALVFIAGCNERDFEWPDAEDGKVDLRVGLCLPGTQTAATRSFAEPVLEFDDLYLAVFVEEGGVYYLDEFVRADNTAPQWNGETGCWEFGASLSKTTDARRIHLIGNYPGLTMGFGEEGQLIGRLVADGADHDTYWACVNVPRIDEQMQGELVRVPMLRNYARIELVISNAAKANFELTGYALYNVPTRGTVAPYNPSMGSFANFVGGEDGNYSCRTYEEIYKGQGYEGNEPYDDGTLLNTELKWIVPAQDGTIPVSYIYERSNRRAAVPTSMLLRGRFKGGDETYYKLDFVYHDSETGANVYYNLLRNFIFEMNVNSVSGGGYETPQEAIRQPASNNIGGDAVAKEYTNISDGVGRLFVSTTYLVLTKKSAVDVYYKYIPDIQNGTVRNTDVVVSAPAGNVLESQAAVAGSDESAEPHKGWRKVTVTPKEPSPVAQSQTITFAAGGLQRQIEIVLRTPYMMSVEVTPEEVASEQNAHVDIKVTIPSGIPVSLFPLRFFISSEENTLYPVAGKNISTEVRDGKYGFVKELSLEEYENAVKESDGRVSFVCNFLTNCSKNATMVYVDNDYFDRGIDQLKNKLGLSIAVGHKVTVPYNTYQYRTWSGNTTVNVYPQKLQEGGTESVRVTVDGVYVGDIAVNETGVTAGIASELPQGCGENSTVRLEFTDKECTGVSGGLWGGVTYSWSNNRTFRAECKLRELLSGNTITFVEVN